MKKIIRKKWLLLSSVTVAMTLLVTAIYSLETAIGDDVDSMELKSIVVEPWENELWNARVVPGNPQGQIEAKIVPGRPKNLYQDAGNKNSMGIRFSFVYSDIKNKVVLIPPDNKVFDRPTGTLNEKNERIVEKVHGIRLPGKVKAVSVWVLGRGNEYELEGWIEDWKGDTHIYKFGSLDFVGWRPLTVVIPDNVPQDVDSYPQTKTLVFKRFVIRATHKTSQEEVVLFFDSLKVLTDMFDVYFDGADMNFDKKDEEKKNDLRQYEENLRKKSSTGGTTTEP